MAGIGPAAPGAAAVAKRDPRVLLAQYQRWTTKFPKAAKLLHPQHYLRTALHHATARSARRVLLLLRDELSSTDVSVSNAAADAYTQALATRVQSLAETLSAALAVLSPHNRFIASLRSRLGSALQTSAANEPAGTALVVNEVIDKGGIERVWLACNEPVAGTARGTSHGSEDSEDARPVESIQRRQTRDAVWRCRQEGVAQEQRAIETLSKYYGQAQFELLVALAYQDEEDC